MEYAVEASRIELALAMREYSEDLAKLQADEGVTDHRT